MTNKTYQMKTIILEVSELAAILDALNKQDLTYCSQSHIDDYTSAKQKIINSLLNTNTCNNHH